MGSVFRLFLFCVGCASHQGQAWCHYSITMGHEYDRVRQLDSVMTLSSIIFHCIASGGDASSRPIARPLSHRSSRQGMLTSVTHALCQAPQL